MDFVITVCNNANNEFCHVWPNKNQIMHWEIDDPVHKLNLTKNIDDKKTIFEKTFNEINLRINDFFKI